MTRAIWTHMVRPGEPVFLPSVGMEFNSVKEAKDFNNLYSWEIGFGMRKGRNRVNDNMYTARRDLVCSCEKFSKFQLGRNDQEDKRSCTLQKYVKGSWTIKSSSSRSQRGVVLVHLDVKETPKNNIMARWLRNAGEIEEISGPKPCSGVCVV